MARRVQEPSNKKAYVGIDFSLTSPGVSINNGKMVIVKCLKAIPRKPKQRNTERLYEITSAILNQISPLWSEFNRKDIFIFIEDYAFGALGKTFDIAECVGILKYRLFYEYRMPFENLFLVSVSHLKLFCSGKGNAQKDNIIKDVFKRWGFDTNNNNEADAFVLMQIAMAYIKNNIDLPAFQIDALKRIKDYNNESKNKKKKSKKI